MLFDLTIYLTLLTFGPFHELENSFRMPMNGLGNLAGLLGGPRKPAWRWNFFFMESISNVKLKKRLKKFKGKIPLSLIHWTVELDLTGKLDLTGELDTHTSNFI